MITKVEFNEVIGRIRDQFGEQFILGVDTAASLLGLTNVYEFPITVITSDTNFNFPEDVRIEVIAVTEPIDSPQLVTVDGFLCTNIERTLRDLLTYDRDPQVVCESLSYYYYSVGVQESWGELPRLAESLGLLDEFNSYIDDAIEHGYN